MRRTDDDSVFVGGAFIGPGDNVAELLLCPDDTFCVANGVQADCPCGNNGASGGGCANSRRPIGALLTQLGPQNGVARFVANGLPPQAPALLLRGTIVTPPTPFGDGLLCLSDGAFAAAGVASQSTLDVSLRHTDGPGRWLYQVAYRNHDAYCRPERFNATNGVVVDWR